MTQEIETMPSPHFKKIMRLIAEDNVTEAARYVAEDFAQVISELQREREVCGAIIEVAKSTPVKANGKGKAKLQSKIQPPRMRFRMDKTDRSDLIRQFAYESAKANGGKVRARELATQIEAAGHNLNTKVPGTMVGNVLHRAPKDWQRIEKGLYRYIGTN